MHPVFTHPVPATPAPSRRSPFNPWMALGALGLVLLLNPGTGQAKDSPAAKDAKAPAEASTAPASAPAQKQRNRMGECSAQFKATGKPGSERKAFMQECLRKPKA
ncbi:PsiF family protein [Curvibacter sp. RS43]|uniref:PsiF family protein n=1 Tax=Curvibacter microcysteis TaxID=3026419 RepID=UPI00235E6C69|nr:PsiF family protein [Curvibacter sp. RS43]MDD0812429.1 PsiF family protein [Curvibacter sp. RS43]